MRTTTLSDGFSMTAKLMRDARHCAAGKGVPADFSFEHYEFGRAFRLTATLGFYIRGQRVSIGHTATEREFIEARSAFDAMADLVWGVIGDLVVLKVLMPFGWSDREILDGTGRHYRPERPTPPEAASGRP